MRGLLSVEDTIHFVVIVRVNLARYHKFCSVNNSEERLLSARKRIWRQSNEYGRESESPGKK